MYIVHNGLSFADRFIWNLSAPDFYSLRCDFILQSLQCERVFGASLYVCVCVLLLFLCIHFGLIRANARFIIETYSAFSSPSFLIRPTAEHSQYWHPQKTTLWKHGIFIASNRPQMMWNATIWTTGTRANSPNKFKSSSVPRCPWFYPPFMKPLGVRTFFGRQCQPCSKATQFSLFALFLRRPILCCLQSKSIYSFPLAYTWNEFFSRWLNALNAFECICVCTRCLDLKGRPLTTKK